MRSGDAGHSPVIGIDHVAVAVHSIDRALPYYVERLGLQLQHRETLPAIGTELAFLDGGSTMLQLVAPSGPSAVADHLEAHGEGLHHVCFAVDDISRSVAVLSNDGDRPPIFVGGRLQRTCFLIEQPNGVLIELTETAQPTSVVPEDDRATRAVGEA